MEKEKSHLSIGKKGTIVVRRGKQAITVMVSVVAWEKRFGSNRYLVSPVSGAGAMWVERIEFIKGK